MSKKINPRLLEAGLIKESLAQSFIKLKPSAMFRNPVMFTVWIGTFIMTGVCIWIAMGETSQGSLVYNIIITSILLITLLFANFAEAIAEARGKAQADSLRKTREDTPAKKIFVVGEMYVNEVKVVPSSQLKKGDHFICEAGDIIPMDGEIVKGLATIDESAITGES
ncbi:MAG: potassium-transporting ATPase subunit B, partial [Chitinophagaceae bacterium]|nr:potassium-transporting ATPase subunit B [Chitinophagaceae bacterium]